ncbi:CheR family methyltransferase [Stutzerimonas azotifigens]|uniref:histidine kinase n=1 Tax=Stutzerimonas azotifigens TaxID=291995 RepID=A0ABR5Z1H1_9GAMM|nr:CheR family methyltransferase [Stutzerimonas azotifigens]MBA1274026.1 PAS domain S-box protein [Stutzerimonas azotifigens]
MKEQVQQKVASVPKNQKAVARSTLSFPVVGVGASAGGLQAVSRFLEHMPANSGMAFVVVIHLSPDHQSHASSILQRATRMPVNQVTGTTRLEADKVFVIPPGKHITMSDGHLRLSDLERSVGRRAQIDTFFRTLADAHQNRAFGIILSGSGADGSVGLARIKEQGGVTLAQSPNDAEYEFMPRCAIDTGKVDLVLPVVDMPRKLLDIWSNARVIHLPQPAGEQITAEPEPSRDDVEADQQTLRRIIAELHLRTGHDFRHYKQATVLRRIERRMQVVMKSDLCAYGDYLLQEPDEARLLLSDLLIGVTNFFRDRQAFEALERDVIPQLFEDKSCDEIRVWSAACSTGEEAYSLAMLLCDQAAVESRPARLQVFASDIDGDAIVRARRGLYPEAIVADVSPTRLRQFFSKEREYYQIRPEVRDKVLFAQHNLLRDPPFSRLDLIVCRNLLIYLDRDIQRVVLQMFHFALRPGGFLFLGGSETAEACPELFSVVDKKNRIYRANSGLRREVRTAPTHREESTAAAPRRQSESPVYGEIHRWLLERFAPPSIIVSRDGAILHLSEGAGVYLRHVPGEPSHDLLKVIHPSLKTILRNALFQAFETDTSISHTLQVTLDDRPLDLSLLVRPFKENGRGLAAILFQAAGDDEATAARLRIEGERALELERELQGTRDELQSSAEHASVSSEEFMASNEELQAVNEELRSATEELEASREDLQRLNEELQMVNQDLRAEIEQSAKTNDDLSNLIASAAVATVFIDRGMRIKWYTPRATEVFKLIPTDAGRPILDVSHRLDYEQLAADIGQVFESLSPVEREVPGHEGRCYIARLLPYRTLEDRIDGAVLTFIDITARREAERKLHEEEQLMRLVAESTCDYAIITMDLDGTVTSWNRGAELTFGYSQAEMLGRSADIIFLPEDLEAGAAQGERDRALQGGRAEDERWHQRKDGGRFYCSGIMTPLGVDEPRGFVKICRDLTVRKQQELAQETELERSQSLSQRKDQFFAMISHELKHPLNLVQLNAELLARLPVISRSTMMSKSCKAILQAVRSQALIIDDLLELSRAHTGKLKLTLTPVDLNQLIGEIINSIHNELLESKLELDYEPRTEPFILEADHTRVEQIIWNLVSNALKFTPRGGQIALKLQRDEEMARVDVTDTGCGIDPASLPYIFDVFDQAEGRPAARTKEGLGIGLALVKELTEAHGGRVEAASEGRGKGSRFSVWLPLLKQTSEQEPPQVDDARDGRLSGVRILLVDDSPDVLETLQLLLEIEGASVLTANSGQAALECLGQGPFDLLISDIGMPGMDGHQLIEAVRKRLDDPPPGIALTGFASQEDVKRATGAGFARHLGKPVSFDALIDAAEAVVRGDAD